MYIGLAMWAVVILTVIWSVYRCTTPTRKTLQGIKAIKEQNKMLLEKHRSDEDYWKAIEGVAQDGLDPSTELIMQYVKQRKEKNAREYRQLPR